MDAGELRVLNRTERSQTGSLAVDCWHTHTHTHIHSHTSQAATQSVTMFQYGASKKFYRSFYKIRSDPFLTAGRVLQKAVRGAHMAVESKLRRVGTGCGRWYFLCFPHFLHDEPWSGLKTGHDHCNCWPIIHNYPPLLLSASCL